MSWVWALAFGVASLSTAEMLPVSLLTPIAADLGVTAGTAGQAVTATAAVAVVSALVVSWATRRLDRRTIVLGVAALQALSCFAVALAPGFAALVAGRLLLGVPVGAFWALAPSLTLRLARPADVPRALGIITGGSSISAISAAPLGSFLGGLIGWRATFVLAGLLGLLALVVQIFTIPSVAAAGSIRLTTLLTLLRRRTVLLGLFGVFVTFGATRMLYSYVRPMLDRTAHGDVTLVALLLLCFGVARVLGASFVAPLLRRDPRRTQAGAALAIAVIAALLIPGSGVIVVTAVLLFCWGLADGITPVGWTTWVTRAISDHPETGGGLQVAVVQFAITSGAAFGGVLIDGFGILGVMIGACVVSLVGAVHIATQLKA
jgi:predicted MFS family arabinose efflux permease